MEHHAHHHPIPQTLPPKQQTVAPNRLRLTFSATLHCLLGCGIGEVSGVIIGTALGWGNMETMILAIILGFVGGFLLGMIPLRRAGFGWNRAFKTVLIAEGLSIVVMETAQVLTELYTPGVMDAGLSDSLFWFGMGLALLAGFAAAFPVNWWLIGRGIRHQH
ncbi:MAG: DUF4396 domain-containing protein [Saprospiraceae bacterium]|nr:DUF4396 domain-containing protein [Saprospiraceae bacterium]